MPDRHLALPPVLRSLLEQLPPELREPIEAKIGVLEAELEKLGPGIAVLEAGLEAAAPFLAIEEAETQAAVAAAAAANETAARAEEQTRLLSRALEEVREAEAARWADAVAALTAMDGGDAVDLDRLARVLGVEDVAATEEAFDAFMDDDDLPLVLGPRRPRADDPGSAPRLDRTGRRLDGDGLVDLTPHLSRLTVPGTLAQSAAGLWRFDGEAAAMLLGDGTCLQVVDGVLVREQDEISDGAAPAPSSLEARRLVGGAPPLLLPTAAAGLASAFACRGRRIEADPDHVPATLGLGAAIRLGDPSEAGLSSVVPYVRALRGIRGNPAAASTSFIALAHDLYRVRTWLEPAPEIPADLPAIHVGQIRWCALAARPVYWMPVFAGDRTMVGGIDRPWTADPPAAGASWQATAPAMRLDPKWVAPLVVVAGDPNVWAIDPDGGWWSLDVDYDAIVLARRAHREPWLRAMEELHRGLASEALTPQRLDGTQPAASGLHERLPGSMRPLDAGTEQGRGFGSGPS